MNTDELIPTLRRRLPAWSPADSGELLYGRLRLSLNLNGLPFPARLGSAERQALHSYVLGREDLLEGLELRCTLGEMPPDEQEFLEERWLAEPGGIGQGDAELLLACDEHGGMLVGAHDHLSFHVIGTCEELLSGLNWLDSRRRMLEQSPGLALGRQGELVVSSPFLCGHGTLLSLVLHLPGLAWWGQIESTLDPLYDEGFSYRTWQEGFGDFILLENLSAQNDPDPRTLLNRALEILNPVFARESNARAELRAHRELELQDRIHRAIALCAGSRMMSYSEFVEHASMLRLASQMGHSLPCPISPLLLELAPAHLQQSSGESGDGRRMARLRADRLREVFGNARGS